jgi:predicted SAM-dependent methyltransferase
VSARNLKNDLEQKFRIHYQVPMDAQKTDIKASSIDFFYSNNTLEHIPQNIIVPILKECSRILNPEGIFSIRIDYGDHWSYFDKSISKYNYLKFSSKEWNKYNPPLQYQNRLRHSDYLKFFHESGFEIIQENVFRPDQIEIDKLNTLSLAQEFQKYAFDDLTITGCWLIGRKR